jgi:hypothetical protein
MLKKISTIIVLGLLLNGNAYSKDTPYMKLINSYEGVERMLICTPLMQQVSSNFKKGLQIKIKNNNYDVQEYLNKIANPPSKFKSLDSMVHAYQEAILFRMVGEWWIAVRMPKEEKAKKAYQKNHISNEAVILVSELSYKELGPYLTRCTDSFIQLKKENNLVKKYVELIEEKAFNEVYNVLNKLTVKKQTTSNKGIIHLACTINSNFIYDINFKEDRVERDPNTITWSFDLDKQILLDTNFQNNPPIFVSIDQNYIRWNLARIPDDEDKSIFKEKYGEVLFFVITDNKINRYSGKVTMNQYKLNRANFLFISGVTVTDGKFDSSNKIEFNSPEGLNHRIEYLEYALLNSKGNKIQKEFIHDAKMTGDCKTTTKTKKF